MCDEYEQKLDRLKALDKKVEELKMKKGEFGLSGRSLTVITYTHEGIRPCDAKRKNMWSSGQLFRACWPSSAEHTTTHRDTVRVCTKGYSNFRIPQ